MQITEALRVPARRASSLCGPILTPFRRGINRGPATSGVRLPALRLVQQSGQRINHSSTPPMPRPQSAQQALPHVGTQHPPPRVTAELGQEGIGGGEYIGSGVGGGSKSAPPGRRRLTPGKGQNGGGRACHQGPSPSRRPRPRALVPLQNRSGARNPEGLPTEAIQGAERGDGGTSPQPPSPPGLCSDDARRALSAPRSGPDHISPGMGTPRRGSHALAEVGGVRHEAPKVT
jgi:hypothetical protein